MSSSSPNCGSGGGADTYPRLRIASLFIILVCSTSAASFPIIAKTPKWLRIPRSVFDFAKYFGSGVIIATAFIHLLSPGLSELASPCLSPVWSTYPFALALCLLSIFSIFIVEFIAFRWGTAKLAKIGARHDAHGHRGGSHAAHGPEGALVESASEMEKGSVPEQYDGDTAMARIVGVAILEFGVMLHSILIGLTLAVDPDFKVLFIVIVFHQTFEGLGIGSRLAFLELTSKYNWVRYAGALLYGITTPIGIATGLGIKSTYNPGSATASIVSGVLDSVSAGILIYTGLVELLAHEFLFNKDMLNGSNGEVAYALICMLLGSAIMALLGKWA